MSCTKIVIASKARYVNQYKNLKRKVLKCCDIYFNCQCLKQNLTSNYTKIKISNTSRAATFITHKLAKLRINYEIKFLYMKKEKLNNALYKVHLGRKVAEWLRHYARNQQVVGLIPDGVIGIFQ